MWNLLKEVKGAIKRLDIRVRILSKEEIDNIFKSIINKYSENNIYEFALCHNLKDYKSVKDSDGWKELVKYVRDKSVILFFEWSDDKNMILFDKGQDVIDVLSDSHRFVFYITDLETSFMLCHNDHDYLISCGKSTNWLTSNYDLK